MQPACPPHRPTKMIVISVVSVSPIGPANYALMMCERGFSLPNAWAETNWLPYSFQARMAISAALVRLNTAAVLAYRHVAPFRLKGIVA